MFEEKQTTAATELKSRILEAEKIEKEILLTWIEETIQKEREQIIKAVNDFNKALPIYPGVEQIIIDNNGEQYYKFIYSPL